MNVKELIEWLSDCNPEAIVAIQDEELNKLGEWEPSEIWEDCVLELEKTDVFKDLREGALTPHLGVPAVIFSAIPLV